MSFITELITRVKQHKRERNKYPESSNSVVEQRQEHNRLDIVNRIDYALTTCATTAAVVSFIHLSWQLYETHLEYVDNSANANSDAVNRLFGSLRKFFMKWNLVKGQKVHETNIDYDNVIQSENERKLRWYERHGLPGGAHGLRRIFGLLNTKQHQQENSDESEVYNTKREKVNISNNLYDAGHLLTPEGTLASEEMMKRTDEHEEEVSSKHVKFDKIETKAKPFTLLAELISSWTRSSDTLIEQRSTSLRPTVMVTNTEEIDINNTYKHKEDIHNKLQDEIVKKQFQQQSSLSEMEQLKEHKVSNAQLSTFTSNTLLHTTNSLDEPLVMTHKSLQNHISYLVHSTHDVRSEDVTHVTVNSEQLTRYHTHACLSLFDKVEAKESDQWNAENSAFEVHNRIKNTMNDTTKIGNIAEKNEENKCNDNTITTLHTNEHHNCSCYHTWADDELHSTFDENNDKCKLELEEQKGEMYKCDACLNKGLIISRKIKTPSVRSELTSSSNLTRTTSSYTNTNTSQTSTNISTNASSQCSNASLQSEAEYEEELQEEENKYKTVKDKATESEISSGAIKSTSTLSVCKELKEKEEEELCIKERATLKTRNVVEEQQMCYHDVLETIKEETNDTVASNNSTQSSAHVPSASSSSSSSVASSSDRSLVKYINPANYQNSFYKQRGQQREHRKCHDKSKLSEDNNLNSEYNYNIITKNNASQKKQTQGKEKEERQCVKVRNSGNSGWSTINDTTMTHRKLTIAQLWRILETRRELQHLHSEALLHNRLLRPTKQPGQVERQHHCVKDSNSDSKVCLLEDDENMQVKCKRSEKVKNDQKLMIKQTEINDNKSNNDVKINTSDANKNISSKEMVSSVTSSSSSSSSPLLDSTTHNNQASVHAPITFTHNSLPSLSETLLSNFPDPALIAACYRNLHRDYNAYGNVLSDLTHNVIPLESFGTHELMPHERMNANALTEVNGNALRFHSLIERRNYTSSQKVSTPEQQKEEEVNEKKVICEFKEDHQWLQSNEVEETEITNVQTNPFTSALSPYTRHSPSLSPSSLNNNENVTRATSNAPLSPSLPSIKERSSTSYSSSVTSYYTSSEKSSSPYSSTSTVSESCSSSVRNSKLDFTQQLLHERRRDDLRVKNYDGSAKYAISLTYHNSITGASKTIDTNVLPPLSLSGSGPFACTSSEKCNKNSQTSTFTKAHPSTCHHSCPLTWQSPLFVEHQNSTRRSNNNNTHQKNKLDTTRTTRQPCKTLSNLSVPMTKVNNQYTGKNKNTRNKGNLSEMYSMTPSKLHWADKELPAASSTTFSSTRHNNTKNNKLEEEEEEAAKRVPLFSAPLPACEPADGPRLQGVAGRRGEMRIGAFLGGGACGKVYECLNTETGQILAAKQIVFDEKDPQLRQRLKQLELELEVLTISARHQCKWIVGFHGAEKRGHSVLMYLEYCEYSSLLDYLTNGNSHDAPVWGGARSVPADPPPSICLYGETARRIAQERQSNLHRLHLSQNSNGTWTA